MRFAKFRRLSGLDGLKSARVVLFALSLAVATVPQARAAEGDCRDESLTLVVVPWREFTAAAPSDSDVFCVKAWGSAVGSDIGPRGFLGRESIATGQQELGTVVPGTRLNGYGAGLSMEWVLPRGDSLPGVPFGGDSGPFDHAALQLSHERAWVEGRSYWDMYDPGAGHALLFPGPLGGASGVALPAYPANIVQDLNYDARLAWSGTELNYDLRGRHATGGFGLRVGAMYGWMDLAETLAGSIPGYASDFVIRNDIQTRATGLHLGLRYQTVLGRPTADQWVPMASLRGQIGIARVRAHGAMTQQFGGFIGGIVPPVTATDWTTGTAVYGSVGGSLSLVSPDGRWQVFGDIDWAHRPWAAALAADGVGSAQVVRQRLRAVTLSAGVRVQF